MIFVLGIFILTALTSSTLAQYNYEKPLKHGGYIYPPPELPFNEAPPIKFFSTLQTSNKSAQKLVEKVPTLGYMYSKPNVLFTLPTPIKISTTSKPVLNLSRLPTFSTKEATSNVPNLAGYEYAHPAISFTYPPNDSKPNSISVSSNLTKSNGYFYSRPSSLGPKETSKEKITEQSTFRPKSSGYTYKRPLIPFVTPTKGESYSSTVPTSQLKISSPYTTPTPSRDFTLAPTISPPPPTIGYTYARPAVPFSIPPSIEIVTVTELPKFKEYSYPVPKEPKTLPNILPKSKDNLNTKQENIITIQTKENSKVSTDRTAKTLLPTASTGNSYSPPALLFRIPPKSLTKFSNVQITQPKTETKKYSKVSSSSTLSPTPSTGYTYSPPALPFTNPPKTTIRPSNVQITKPTDSSSKPISSPETYSVVPPKQLIGYFYSRPDIPFKTPTRSKTAVLSSSVIQPSAPTKSPKSNGYSYAPPKVTFTIPSSTPADTHSPPNELTSKTQTRPPTEMGYSYPKPGIPFEF